MSMFGYRYGAFPLRPTTRLETASRARLAGQGNLLALFLFLNGHRAFFFLPRRHPQYHAIPEQCRAIRTPLDPPPGFTASHTATGSDRFVPGTRATLIRNAKILTGGRNGTEVIYGDVLLHKGVVLAVGYIPAHIVLPEDLNVIDAGGKWVSPGLAVDLDALVRLSNEFKFPITSIHHAGETYLGPDLLKRAWGNLPAIALFASNFRKKREAYRGSEFAPRILADNGLSVIMKSDHPVLNSRYLMYEAQQAHYHSLNPGLAIRRRRRVRLEWAGESACSRKATMPLEDKLDLVLWDSHPLALGATLIQVFIDGIPQLAAPALLSKPDAFQHVPQTPNWEKEVRQTIEHEGLPPLESRAPRGTVAFVGVRDVSRVRDGDGPQAAGACAAFIDSAVEVIDLEGGALALGLTTFGSDFGLSEIMLEPSTTDGPFGGRNAFYAYRGGVTTAIVARQGNGFLQGIGAAFCVGARNALARGAIVQAETSLHVSLHSGMAASVSTQIAALRECCYSTRTRLVRRRRYSARHQSPQLGYHGDSVAAEYDAISHKLWMTFTGASETHLLAAEIGAAGVSVILSPVRPYPANWDSRRILPGPPLSRDSATTTLLNLRHNVNVGLGVNADYDARNARFDMAWAALDSNGTIDYPTALALSSTNIEKALGIKRHARDVDELVVFRGGGPLDMESKVIGVVSARKSIVEFNH
ncbi:hypothetical protein C8R44DRAFT_751081 [Mycena epipterygia]|nr:hypothetical protein C8R44DRAFT_751081 [Mycena epipterygia]